MQVVIKHLGPKKIQIWLHQQFCKQEVNAIMRPPVGLQFEVLTLLKDATITAASYQWITSFCN